MRAAVLIAIKDLKQRARDRTALLMAFVIPVVLVLIFDQTLSGVSGPVSELEIVFVDEERSELGGIFRNQVLGSLEDDGLVIVLDADSEEEATQIVGDDDADAAIVLPPDFEMMAYTDEPESIHVIANVNSFLGPLVAEAVAEGFASELNTLSVAMAATGVDASNPAAFGRVAANIAATQGLITMEDFSASRKELDSTTFYSAGMAVFFVFFTVQFGITSLIEERKRGTMPRLLAAPIPTWSILAGKIMGTFAIGVVSMLVLFGATSLIIGAEWGNPVGVVLLLVLAVLAAMGIMTLVASVTRTVEQAGNAQAVVAVVMGMVGGTFFPVTQIGGLIATVSLLTPHAWFIKGLSGLQAGGNVADIWLPALAILTFAIVTGGIGLSRTRRMVAP